MGYNSLLNSTADQNTGIGAYSNVSTGVTNSTVLGYSSYTNTSNLALLGNTTTLYTGGYSNWSNFSDGRFKTHVQENVGGLNFIMKLRPVTYRIDVRALDRFIMGDENAQRYEASLPDALAAKERVTYTGFIAQEVETAARSIGFDFSGVNVPADKTRQHYSISYADFVPALVKAMQEQQQQIEELKTLVKKQQQQLDTLQK